jgi:hypothetical protein
MDVEFLFKEGAINRTVKDNKSEKKHPTYVTTEKCLKQHCKKRVTWSIVSVVVSAVIGWRNKSTSGFIDWVRSAISRNVGGFECWTILRWRRTSILMVTCHFGPQRIQALFFQPKSTLKGLELVCVTVVTVCSPGFVDGSGIQPKRLRDELVLFLPTHAIAVNATVLATQRWTSQQKCHISLSSWCFARRVLLYEHFCFSRKDYSGHQRRHTYTVSGQIFPYIMQELIMVILTEIWCSSDQDSYEFSCSFAHIS